MRPHRLITIRISHYNEKARWALDLARVPYDEAGYMPLIHQLPVALATRGRGKGQPDQSSTRFSTPLLITADGRQIQDSEKILRYADRLLPEALRLLPSEEAQALATRFHQGLFFHARRYVYAQALGTASLLEKLTDANVGGWQSWAVRGLARWARGTLHKQLNINPEKAARSRDRVLEFADDVDRLLADGRPFLADDRFTAADLNLACGLSLVLLVRPDEGYAAVLPPLSLVPPAFAELIRELRARPCGQHALRMFREQRGERLRPMPPLRPF